MAQWWQQQPTTDYGTPVDITLSTGVQDIEKGNIYAAPAGTPISVPVPAKVAWEDSQHVVLQTAQGVLSFLHVNPTVQPGTVLQPGQSFAKSSSLVGTARDPDSGITYTETGGIVEFGLYDSIKRAISRENVTKGRDNPHDFTGISDPTSLVSAWQSGGAGAQYSSSNYLGTGTDILPLTIGTLTISPKVFLIGAALLVLLLVLR